MPAQFYQQIRQQLDTAHQEGLFKQERIITSAQSTDIEVGEGEHVINFCANNYLGLANHPALIQAAKEGMDSHGFGMVSALHLRHAGYPQAAGETAGGLSRHGQCPFSTPHASTPTAACLKPCWMQRTLLSPMR